jgi:hypothetical protein
VVTGFWTRSLVRTGSDEGFDLLEHLLMDRLIKVVIMIVALCFLALGMVVIWRITNRRR